MNRNLEDGESGWMQDCCENVVYEPSAYQKEINDLNPQKQRTFWTMSFDYTFMYASDEVYVAYTVPYTYSMLLSHLKQLKILSEDCRKSPFTCSILMLVPLHSLQIHQIRLDWDFQWQHRYPTSQDLEQEQEQ